MKETLSLQQIIECSMMLRLCRRRRPEATTIWLTHSNSNPQADVPLPLGLLFGAGSLPRRSQIDRDLFRRALSRLLQIKVPKPQARALQWLGERVPDLVTIHQRTLDAYICPNGIVRVVPRPGSEELPVFAEKCRWHGTPFHPEWKCRLLAEAIRGPRNHAG